MTKYITTFILILSLGTTSTQAQESELDSFLDSIMEGEAQPTPKEAPAPAPTPPPAPKPQYAPPPPARNETAGMSAAQIRELGVDYAEARNGKYKNEQRAIELYRKAADMGDMKAQRWMGWRYRQGRGVQKNEQRARMYFNMAAQQGDEAAAKAIGLTVSSAPSYRSETYGMSAAQIRELGVDYAEARNGKYKNEQRAIELYRVAADMGDMKAQRWMGWRYRQGRGVQKNEQRARMYFNMAAQQGDEAAYKALHMK